MDTATTPPRRPIVDLAEILPPALGNAVNESRGIVMVLVVTYYDLAEAEIFGQRFDRSILIILICHACQLRDQRVFVVGLSENVCKLDPCK